MNKKDEKEKDNSKVVKGSILLLIVIAAVLFVFTAPMTEAQEVLTGEVATVATATEAPEPAEESLYDAGVKKVKDGSCFMAVKLSSKWDFEALRSFVEDKNCVLSVTVEGVVE